MWAKRNFKVLCQKNPTHFCAKTPTSYITLVLLDGIHPGVVAKHWNL